ncbi:MAG: hypothetical protein OXH13_07230 [Chloroflexi bacterium]|nr:hypothetical protein [Chloroflexota bacterium]
MTRARHRRGVRKRRAAREAKERRARRVPAASVLPRPPERRERPDSCRHIWEEPAEAGHAGGLDQDLIRCCESCGGFARRCPRCRRFHLPSAGAGGEDSMPWWVSEGWLREHGCPRRPLGEVPIPFVWLPDGEGLPEFELAEYEALKDEPGRCELRWLS